jgi:hypothetical protein
MRGNHLLHSPFVRIQFCQIPLFARAFFIAAFIDGYFLLLLPFIEGIPAVRTIIGGVLAIFFMASMDLEGVATHFAF